MQCVCACVRVWEGFVLIISQTFDANYGVTLIKIRINFTCGEFQPLKSPWTLWLPDASEHMTTVLFSSPLYTPTLNTHTHKYANAQTHVSVWWTPWTDWTQNAEMICQEQCFPDVMVNSSREHLYPFLPFNTSEGLCKLRKQENLETFSNGKGKKTEVKITLFPVKRLLVEVKNSFNI